MRRPEFQLRKLILNTCHCQHLRHYSSFRTRTEHLLTALRLRQSTLNRPWQSPKDAICLPYIGPEGPMAIIMPDQALVGCASNA